MYTPDTSIQKQKLIHLLTLPEKISTSKFSRGIIKYAPHETIGVVCKNTSAKTVRELYGFGPNAPVFEALEDAPLSRATALLVGESAAGGALDPKFKQPILTALKNGLSIFSPCHQFLSVHPELLAIAEKTGASIVDLRKPPRKINVAAKRCMKISGYICLTVGTNNSIGKMSAAIELDRLAKTKKIDSQFIATGQTGIMIEGWGVAIDAVQGDFMAGAAEALILATKEKELFFVEGQSSLARPDMSVDTLALLHGTMPDGLIFCITARDGMHVKDTLNNMALCLGLARLNKPHCKIVGVSANLSGLSEQEAKEFIVAAEKKFGLPVADPFRHGVEKLLNAVRAHKKEIGK